MQKINIDELRKAEKEIERLCFEKGRIYQLKNLLHFLYHFSPTAKELQIWIEQETENIEKGGNS